MYLRLFAYIKGTLNYMLEIYKSPLTTYPQNRTIWSIYKKIKQKRTPQITQKHQLQEWKNAENKRINVPSREWEYNAEATIMLEILVWRDKSSTLYGALCSISLPPFIYRSESAGAFSIK